MKHKLCLLSAFGFYLMSGITVYASGVTTDTGNAVQDIMNDDRFAGAMSSINWLTGVIDHYSTMFITLLAFSIIAAALLRNVCAAAYCSNSKFWNKVAEAHEAAEGASLASIASGIKDLPKKTLGGQGGIKGALLCIVPNIKALTDFDDVDMEPKHYWMKAIPQMLACIVIGVFVYNGYYRDTSAVVGEMGSEVISRALASVDPSTMIDKLTLTTGTPDNIFKNDPTIMGNMNYEVSMELYKKFRAAWSISSTEDKTNLMRNCEAVASDFTRTFSNYCQTPINSNKVFKLSGLSITAISNNPATRGAAPIAGAWYASNGVSTVEQAFETADRGISYAFTLYHAAPDVNGESLTYTNAAYFCISGTLTKVDGDSTNQVTNIVGQSSITGNVQTIYKSIVPLNVNTLQWTEGDTGNYKSMTWVKYDSIKVLDATTYVTSAINDSMNSSNLSDPEYTISNVVCNVVQNSKYAADPSKLGMVANTNKFNVEYSATYTFTAKDGTSQTGRAVVTVQYELTNGS